jgi:hypothetical protein
MGVLALALVAAGLLLRGPHAAIAEETQPTVEIPQVGLSGPTTFKSKQPALMPMAADGVATDLDAVTEIRKKLRSSNENGSANDEAFAAALKHIAEQDSLGKDAAKREPRLARNYGATENSPTDNGPTGAAGNAATDPLADLSSETSMAFAAAAIEHQKVYDAELDARADVLRKAARRIDAVAADLDAANFDEQADMLFERARALRYEARRVRAPQMLETSAHENDLQSLQYNLHVLRTYLQLYRIEHDGQSPDALPDAEGRVTLHQLTTATNAKGEVGEGPGFPHGPYMLSIPLNPLAETKHAAIVIAIDDWPPRDVQPNAGWLYHPPSGRIAPNTPGHLLD